MVTDPGTPAPASGVDLSACDREPIHVPGSIQPHGVLLVLGDGGDVVQASENAARPHRPTRIRCWTGSQSRPSRPGPWPN